MNYILHRKAKSFYFLKNIGYKYIRTSESTTQKLLKLSQMRLKSYFILMKFIFEFSENIKYEKDMLNLRLTNMLKKFDIIRYILKTNFNKDFYFYYETISEIINCIYISDGNINILLNLKKLIEMKKEFNFTKLKNS